MSDKTSVNIFSTFGSKIIKFEWKKLEKKPQKIQKPKNLKVAGTLVIRFFHMKNQNIHFQKL